jgi:WD40 repeat protein
MKNSKIFKVFVGAVVLMTTFFVGVPLHTMISEKSTAKHLRMQPPMRQQARPERYKNKLIWVKTSDNIRMKLPEWQIDQMKVIQVLLVHQKGENSKDNPIDASMVTSEQLKLLYDAFMYANDLEKLEQFCNDLKLDAKNDLINGASILEAQGLLSVIMNIMFSPEIQEKLGASVRVNQKSIIVPVVEYLKEKQNQKKIFKGHKGGVSCVAYSRPDGNYIVSGSAIDNKLILWNGRTGEQIKIFKGHGYEGSVHNVNCVAYSPDSNYIVSGNDYNLIIWDGKTGEQIKILKGHGDRIYCVAYSPDGNYIVSGAKDKDLILWNGKTGEKIKALKGHDGVVWCVAYSPDGNYIVSGSDDNNLILWNGKTGEKIRILEGHDGLVWCVAYSPDGNYIVSGSQDKNLILWNGKTGEQIEVLEGNKYSVNCVAYSPDGKYIVSGSWDKLILWNSKTREQIKTLQGHDNVVWCVAYSPDGSSIVSGSSDGNLILWKLIDQTIDYIATQLNIAQARLLYRLYLAQKNEAPVILDKKDADYQIYLTLPDDVQRVIKAFLPFELASDVVEKQIQEKMNEHRSKFKKMAATNADKIKTLKILMKDLDKDSIDYKACERLLREIELEEAFEV